MNADNDLALINPDILPPQIRVLIRLIGVQWALLLLENRGGLPLYLSHKKNAIDDLLPADKVQAIKDHFGVGNIVDIPKADKLLQQIRNHYIVNAKSSNTKTGYQLAKEFNLTWRRVKQICATARLEQHDPNGDLFD